MKPWELIGEGHAPDGTLLALTRQDREYVIVAGGRTLMSSRMHGSEEALAAAACRTIRRLDRPSVLIGGLGMGFTLRAALDLLPRGAEVVVSELVAAVVDWNRGPLAALARRPLEDPRVRVALQDVAATIREHPAGFDAILLDVDNGPAAFTAAGNRALYDNAGIQAARLALKPHGCLAVWSAWDDRKFEQRLRYHGFAVTVDRVRARLEKGGPHHTIFLGVLGPASSIPGTR